MNAIAAREKAGFPLPVAAKRARVKPAFLARLERTGGFSYPLAARLAALYGCGLDCFLNLNHNPKTPQTENEKTAFSDIKRNVFATARNVAGAGGGTPPPFSD